MQLNIKSKKGQVFTLFAIAMIVLFFVSYEIYSIVQDRQAIRTRISTMDSFLGSLEKSMERELYITGFRTLFLAEDYIARTGNYVSDVNALFSEAFFSGIVYGNASEILIGARYNDLVNSTNEKAGKINVNVSFGNPEFFVSQEDPWNIVVNLRFNLTMRDKGKALAYWQKQEHIKAYVSIEGFEDPLYIVNTRAMVAYKINKTLYDGTYASGTSTANLTLHLQNHYFAESSDAPSFLKRMAGSLEADENGIESLVDLPLLSSQGIQVQQKSAVDHVYFSAGNPAYSSIAGMPSWFRLDSAHLAKYNVTQLAS